STIATSRSGGYSNRGYEKIANHAAIAFSERAMACDWKSIRPVNAKQTTIQLHGIRRAIRPMTRLQ
ncbi:hypothetical protein Dimus_013461, partial [Dionaea muscipula]